MTRDIALASTLPAPPYDSEVFRIARQDPPPFRRRCPGVPVLGELPKRCGCGASYDATAWAALPFVGAQDDHVAWLDCRNCTCGSTIAVEVES